MLLIKFQEEEACRGIVNEFFVEILPDYIDKLFIDIDISDDLDILYDHSIAFYLQEGVEIETGEFTLFWFDFMHLLTNTLGYY